MKKIIGALGLTTTFLALQVAPIFADSVGDHLHAAQTAASVVANELHLAATSSTLGDIDLHTNQAMDHLTTAEMELLQAKSASGSMVQIAMINFVLQMASYLRMLAHTTLSSPVSLKHYRAQMTWLYGHEFHHQIMRL